MLKDNPGKFFSVVDSLFYKTEGNVIYGFYNGKKLEYTRTVYNLSENKETLYLKGYFNGTFEVWDGTSTSEKDYSSYPPTWKGFLFTFNGLEVNPRTGIFAGDKITVTAQQDQKGHLINATTYNWEVTAPILSEDGLTYNESVFFTKTVHTNYDGYLDGSNDPSIAFTIPMNALGLSTVKFSATYAYSGSGPYVEDVGNYESGSASGYIYSSSSAAYGKAKGSARFIINKK